jgi:hypothetical protein
LPVLAGAQINRSARELASEQVQQYVKTKLFNGIPYKPISFGQLKEHKEKNNDEMAWMIEHRFEVTEPHSFTDQKTPTPKTYTFLFYLDQKMKVLLAETYTSY